MSIPLIILVIVIAIYALWAWMAWRAVEEPILPDTRTMEEIAHDSNDSVWRFAQRNRDLMPVWELHNPHVSHMQPHRRYSDWATYCANVPGIQLSHLDAFPIVAREALEDDLLPPGERPRERTT